MSVSPTTNCVLWDWANSEMCTLCAVELATAGGNGRNAELNCCCANRVRHEPERTLAAAAHEASKFVVLCICTIYYMFFCVGAFRYY